MRRRGAETLISIATRIRHSTQRVLRIGPLHLGYDCELPGLAATRERAVRPQVRPLRAGIDAAAEFGMLDGKLSRFLRTGTRCELALDFPGIARLFVRRDGSAVEARIDSDRRALRTELLLGVVPALALALRGVFVLHASAVSGPLTLAFVGASGAGKSTLAAALAAHAGWRRIADDALPVALDRVHTEAWLGFPQLKLAPRRWRAARGERVRLDAIALLERGSPGTAMVLEALTPSAGRRALLAHSIGARLFDAPLLQHHLATMTAVVARVPCFRLAVPETSGPMLPIIDAVRQELVALVQRRSARP
jgi:predicted kinase